MWRNADVLVSGAGPVGLFAAHSLSRAGVSVQIVDTGIWPCAHSYALALHPRTVDLLSKAGLQINGNAVSTMALYDGKERRAEIRLADVTGQPMVVLPQSELESQLEAALEAADVQVHWRHKVMHVDQDREQVRIALDRYEQESCGYVVARTKWVVGKSWTAESAFLVGADGYDSAVRRSLGLEFTEVAPCSWYAVFEFASDADVPQEVRVILGENTTDVLWPLGDGRYRWGFQLTAVDPELEQVAVYRQRFGEPSERNKDRQHFTAGEVNILPDSQLLALIGERAPWFQGSIDEIGWRTIVRFERRLANAFGKGRCWLAGDSAHLAGPVGVQSLNVGLVEAQELSAAIATSLENGGAAETLKSYNARYSAEWKRLQGVDVAIEPCPKVDGWVWENRNRLLSCLPGYGADLTSLASQIGLRV